MIIISVKVVFRPTEVLLTFVVVAQKTFILSGKNVTKISALKKTDK